MVLDDFKRVFQTNGRMQKLFLVIISLFAISFHYSETFIALQKTFPTAVCSKKFEKSNPRPCTSEMWCDSKYTKQIDYKHSIKNWKLEISHDCNDNKYFDYFISAFYIGEMLNNILFSSLGDKYGRKKVISIQYPISIVIFALFFTSSSISTNVLLIFLYSLINSTFCIIMVYSSELLTQTYYSIVMTLIGLSVPTAMSYNSVFLLIFKDWKINHMIMLVMMITFYILFVKYYPESPSYLYSKGEYTEYLKEVESIAKFNGTQKDYLLLYRDFELKDTANRLIEDKEEHSDEGKGGVFKYLNKPKIRNHLAALIIVYSIMKVIFFGTMLNMEKYINSVYLGSIIFSLADGIGQVVSGYLSCNYGRKTLICMFMAAAGVCFFIFNLFNQYELLSYILLFLYTFFLCCNYNTLLIFIPEYFDFQYRSTCTNFVRFFGNFFTIFSPYILSELPSPFLFYSIFCFIAAGSGYYFQETFKYV